MADASDSERGASEDAMTVCVTILSKLLAITIRSLRKVYEQQLGLQDPSQALQGGKSWKCTFLPSILGSPSRTRTVAEGRCRMASSDTPSAAAGPAQRMLLRLPPACPHCKNAIDRHFHAVSTLCVQTPKRFAYRAAANARKGSARTAMRSGAPEASPPKYSYISS